MLSRATHRFVRYAILFVVLMTLAVSKYSYHIINKADDNKPIATWEKVVVVNFLKLRATFGMTSAQNNLSYLYDQGKLLPKDKKLSLYWMKRAAENENPMALYNLGIKYMNGEDGLDNNPKKAIELMLEAAKLHNKEVLAALKNNKDTFSRYYANTKDKNALEILKILRKKG